MFILISIILLAITSLVMLIVRLVRPGFLYHWLIALGGGLAAWVLVLLAGTQLPRAISLFSFEPGSFFPSWPVLLVDRLSWPYAAALVTLALSVILTDVARAAEAEWHAWAACLGLTALGLMAVLAGDPLALLLAWTAIDIAEVLIYLIQFPQSSVRERVVVAFSARLFSSVLVVAAAILAYSKGESLSFSLIPPSSNLLLLLAASFRLGVLPLHWVLPMETYQRRSLGTIARLVPVAAALALLGRTAAAEEQILFAPYLVALAALAGLYGAATWALSPDGLQGRPAWILGVVSLAVTAAVRQQPAASLAWGMAALLSGGLVFLTSIRDRRLTWITLLGLFGISALPFSPTWNGVRLFEGPPRVTTVLFLVVIALLIAGYARHAPRLGERPTGIERWVWLIYPLGLILLPLTHILFGVWTNPGLRSAPVAGWWVGPAALGIASLLTFWMQRDPSMLQAGSGFLNSVLSMNWLYRFLWFLYRTTGRIFAILNSGMEGNGGILWAFLVLVLLILMVIR